MPEGPEIVLMEKYIRSLLFDKRLNEIESNTNNVVNLPSKQKVIDTGKKGKLFWLKTRTYYLHIHLGLTGWLKTDKPDVYKYAIHTKNISVYIEDQRRFSSLKVMNEREHNDALSKLGVDIFSRQFTVNYLRDILHNRSINICSFLLSQDKICGVGNYIKSESLYIAGISPKKKSDKIPMDKIRRLHKAIRYVSFSNALSWLKNYDIDDDLDDLDVPTDAVDDYILRVYHKKKDPEGNNVIEEKIGGRDTFYVPHKQL